MKTFKFSEGLAVNSRNTKKQTKKKNKKKKSKAKNKKMNQVASKNNADWKETMNKMVNWQYKHQIAYWKSKAIALEYENNLLHQIIKSSKFKSDTLRQSQSCSSESEDTSEAESENSHQDHEERVEVSEAFIKFLTQNEKHKQELQKEKDKFKSDYLSEEQVVKIMEAPPKQMYEQREKEMKLLYGDLSNKIVSLETMIQLDFDLNCDKYKPIMWPNIPLKL